MTTKASAAQVPSMLDRVSGIGLKSAIAADQSMADKRHQGRLLNGVHAASRLVRAALEPLTLAWRYRELVRALLRRELADRFRGALFGWAWAIAGPLIALATYIVIFTGAMRLPVASAQSSRGSYALSTFVGLIVFSLCAELFYRAPLLLHERASYIKNSIFPSEMLAWTAVFRALAYAGISVVVLLVFQVGLIGTVPASVLLLPLIVLPLVLFLLGIVWCLAALGGFTRDIAYLMTAIIPVLMFATPVFYRISDLPVEVRRLAYFSPLAVPIEMARAVLLGGAGPPAPACVVFVIVAFVIFRAGFAVFVRYKGILADVI
jgi:lipopolysaccharide transport system permease protein